MQIFLSTTFPFLEIKHRLKTKRANRLYKIHGKLSKVRAIGILIYMSLPFFQKPPWCVPTDYTSDCASNLHKKETYPITSLFYLNNQAFVSIEIFLMIFLTLNMCMKFFFLESSKTRNIRMFFYILATLITIATDLAYVINDVPVQIDLLIRPFFLLFYKYFNR